MIIEENHLPDVRGLAKVRVETEAQALRCFFEGEKSRTYGHHSLNPVPRKSVCNLSANLCKPVTLNLCENPHFSFRFRQMPADLILKLYKQYSPALVKESLL